MPPRSQGPGHLVLRNCTRTSVCGVCVLHPPYSLWDHLWLPGLGPSSAPSWIHTAVHCVWNVLVCIFCLHVSKSFCESSKSTSGLGSRDLDSVIDRQFPGALVPRVALSQHLFVRTATPSRVSQKQRLPSVPGATPSRKTPLEWRVFR